MRNWFVALLIVLFTGVSTAAAFNVEQSNGGAIELTSSVEHEMSAAFGTYNSHHGKCCESSGEHGASAKTSSCAIDCPSLFVDDMIILFQANTTLEKTPLSEFSALKIYPKDQPPKHS
jgi:hypothetical protein